MKTGAKPEVSNSIAHGGIHDRRNRGLCNNGVVEKKCLYSVFR